MNGEWWHPYLRKVLAAAKKADAESKQLGGAWNDVLLNGKHYWPRYAERDGVLVGITRDQLRKAAKDGIAGLLVCSMKPRTRVWVVPIDNAIWGFNHWRLNYKKHGRTI